ncbi:acylase [Sphingomonas sp. MAH-20]|uniref:Acylase n=1 Tax=Sphingomonas horti TaxID=2682842 RepID=A0A6I4J5K4_9SPHN|nr:MULTISPECIES: penicillin acylase family protein [Sphingomonas]MBA2921152.1 penicillin acylase family protein [Sphingomonas sp. CGMCC 1.13658]MVO79393.1 acylase [Sphingomonas horti]
MLTLAFLLLAAAPQADLARWQAEAARVTITRDDWGIAHVKGRTDADAVFGAIYAQAEDDFNRIERNYLIALGRQAEADGEGKIWDDLRARLYVDEAGLRAAYARSPKTMQALMNAWADGLNHFLATHPEVKPKVLTRFEPWMALSFTEGSIGGDIERIDLDGLRAFYGGKPPAVARADTGEKEPSGSNGFAIAPAKTADGHALLLINPHTSFFFRSELQMTSDEGLNAYGASTWGQFFIYQGFNPHIGWMHTSSGVDVVDEFAEAIVRKGGRLFYRYGKELRPVETRVITVRYRAPNGGTAARSFTTYRTHHGPIVRQADGKWVAFAMMFKPVEALQQSWLRTKADDFASFLQVAELKANSSNNTIFASDKGEIAYLHPQFVPLRDNRFDYTRPVDGSDPATDWKGLTPLARLPQVVNPPNGWVMNTNNWPYSAAAENSPRQAEFPRYMDTFGENPRGVHATMVLKDRRDFTLPLLIDAAFDSYLPAFARLIPTLVRAYDGLEAKDPLKAKLKGQIALLRSWDYRWGIASQPTSLAVFWGEALWKDVKADAESEAMNVYDYMAERTTPRQRLKALADASDQLERDFGHWGVAWGEINRFQRLTGDIVQPFDDKQPSIPVPFTSSRWGSLASFGAKAYPGTRRWYGTSGNSFVAVVEFGPKVRARAITAGGESGHPGSPHFNDEAERYTTGNLREVYFWPEQLKGHTERIYRPGQ